MKNKIHFKIATTFSFVLFFQLLSLAQSGLSSLPFTGSDYKMVQSGKINRFAVTPEFGYLFPHQSGLESYSGRGMDSLLFKVYSDPLLFGQLMERLGGEFFIGSFSGSLGFENFQQEGGKYFGVSGAYRINPHFETQLFFSNYKTQVTAEFPVVVFDQETMNTTTEKGILNTDLHSNSLGIAGIYYPLEGVVQPFAGAGVVYTDTRVGDTKAEIAGIVVDLGENASVRSFGFLLNAGLAINVHRNIVVKLNGQLFSVTAPDGSGAAWNKAISIGTGFRF